MTTLERLEAELAHHQARLEAAAKDPALLERLHRELDERIAHLRFRIESASAEAI